MNPLDLTRLSQLMARTSGIPEIIIGLIDGPVSAAHPDLTPENLRTVPGLSSFCKNPESNACRHGTFLAGILNAKRSSVSPSICPGCTLLVRPVFSEYDDGTGELPGTTPEELGTAIVDCIREGARLLNLSVALEKSSKDDLKLEAALDHAAARGVVVVAAAGNQGVIGASALTRHPWVIPVVACDLQGMPSSYSNLARSIGRKGLRAPGEKITSIGSSGSAGKFCGTSIAASFVTGAIALLWSVSPRSNGAEIKSAITSAPVEARRSIIPPLLNAWEAYNILRGNYIFRRAPWSERKTA